MVVTLTGLPISSAPRIVTSGVNEERYPCERCSCGCSSAEHCWDHCCCYSDIEKLRWAEANHVQPPAFLKARVAKAALTKAKLLANATCCHCGHAAALKAATNEKVESPPSPKSKVILLWKAAQCQGVTSLWTMLSSVVVPVKMIALEPHNLGLDCVWFSNQRGPSRRDRPEPPIP